MNENGATVANYATSATVVIGGIALQHWVAIIGLLFALITFAVDMRDKHAKRRQAAELAELDRRIREAQLRALERQ